MRINCKYCNDADMRTEISNIAKQMHRHVDRTHCIYNRNIMFYGIYHIVIDIEITTIFIRKKNIMIGMEYIIIHFLFRILPCLHEK